MDTLIDRIETAARSGRRVVFTVSEPPEETTWDVLLEDSRAVAAALQTRGVGVGSHVAVLGATSRNLVTTIEAIWLAGATLVVLPLPMRMSIEAFVDATRRRISRADASLLVIDDDLLGFFAPSPEDPPVVTLTDLVADGHDAYARPSVSGDDLAILQFTSGSTADPRGVMLPNCTVGANLDAIAAGLELHPTDEILVSWLPLYHDMGLIGLLSLAMTTGASLVLGSPQVFLAEPGRWMRWVSEYGGTLTAGPNFSWVLAGRALGREEGDLDLSPLRVALNGAEAVDPDASRALVAAGRRHRLRAESIFPAYGMAESTVGTCFPRPLSGLRTDRVERAAIEHDGRAIPATGGETKELVVLGRPIPGLEIRVVDPAGGEILPDRRAGELEIRGTSVTPGYYGNPEATARLFHDGWMRSGDLAYLVDGELVICGRIKDLIIVGGRNIYPEDVERAVSDLPGVRAGNVIAFGVGARTHTEALVVVAESKADDPEPVQEAIRHRTLEATGVSPRHVVLLPPGSLPKTSSGKLQRSLCRERYESGAYRPL